VVRAYAAALPLVPLAAISVPDRSAFDPTKAITTSPAAKMEPTTVFSRTGPDAPFGATCARALIGLARGRAA